MPKPGEYEVAFADSLLRRFREYRGQGKKPTAIRLLPGEVFLLREYLEERRLLKVGRNESRLLGMEVIVTKETPAPEDRFVVEG